LNIIVGQRGVGKTTAIIQHLLTCVNNDVFSGKILYIPSDHILIGSKSLYEIAEEFLSLGGKWLAFDEIHKCQNWSKELKSIYDTFPELQIIASGSSALEIFKGSHDLSRRAIKYKMNGMSFREFLELEYNLNLESKKLTIEDVYENHLKIASEIINLLKKKNLKVIPLFKKYLRFGYYPYFHNLNMNENLYQITLEQNIHTTIESDLVAIYPEIKGHSIKKIKQLLSFISDSVPFIPNWKKLLEILNIGDQRSLKTYFKLLEDARLIKTLSNASDKMRKIESAEKVYLNNPNQLYAISSIGDSNIGTVRETFFISMLSEKYLLTLPNNGDFLVNKKYLFEIGGKNKSFSQIKNDNNFKALVCDDIEIGSKNKIPLWLFGFLY
jgi:uncharacterized protein